MYITCTKYYEDIELWRHKPRYSEIMDKWYNPLGYGSIDVSSLPEIRKLITFETSPLRIDVLISKEQEKD